MDDTKSQLMSTLDELQRDGVLQRSGERYQTTRRWRAARHRASSAQAPASDSIDRQNPIVQALLAFYGERRPFATLSPYVAVVFALESSERLPHSEPVPRR